MINYKNLILDIVGKRTSITRKFFIVIKSDKNINESVEKIIAGLSYCGNEVNLCDENKIKELLNVYFFKNNIGEEV